MHQRGRHLTTPTVPTLAYFCLPLFTSRHPYTLPSPRRAAVLEAAAYWRTPLKPMMGSRQLTEFYVLDAEAAVPQGELCSGGSAAGLKCSGQLPAHRILCAGR